MKQAAILAFAAAALVAAATPGGWTLTPPTAASPLELTYSEGAKVVYRLTCGASDVAISQYGVTELLDVQTNTKIGDGPGASMTPGASLMALATDKGDPEFVGAVSTANPAGGWDMTVRVRKNDPTLLSLPKARMVSLFTTGFTRAVGLGKADRKLFADFIAQCRAP
jgi:hypothetical protein